MKTVEIEKLKSEVVSEVGLIDAMFGGKVTSISITTPEQYTMADQALVNLRLLQGSIKDRFFKAISPLKEAVKKAKEALGQVEDIEGELLTPVSNRVNVIKREMGAYQTRLAIEKEKAAEEQARVDEEARKKDLALKAKLEAAKTTAAQANIQKQRVAIAQERAAATVATPVIVKAAGSSVVTTYKGKVTVLKEFLHGVIDGTIPEDVLSLNESVLNSYVRSDIETVRQWPGVEVVPVVNIRAAR